MTSSASAAPNREVLLVTVNFEDFLIAPDFSDAYDMPISPFYNNAFATTGLKTVAIGSQETFRIQPYRNGLPWDLSAGSATLYLADPTGTIQSPIGGSIVAQGAQANWVVAGMAGTWTFAWALTDAFGNSKKTLPYAFGVVSSPV